mmetsp:Transcript_1747/g.3420  ORF Transcript_1747/g.3420 Transcript_1747/m.3420 type:complete len:481 (-) Transcript_1747:84-1526(-)|eukprot:CAMPEP_0118656582 /NCGR_PEP_ID=MMETSP0785-20121206/13563_1 /TAXON_ID=91992 /ORGANISM="Bolidomonas pacifica, Strain CCMP 1866" /LENGTH=480 /DNA_ID=CAMNT_0006549445 /DNA_START=125 /DNA_END=1567 /DNA_ORIENTATION=-
MVLAVSEDWGVCGASNGLGTLYAFKKACAVAQEKHGVDLLFALSENSVSAALYHTAGKGTRMAPLPASENNNKPAVRLPATIKVGGENVPMTVLEAVIKQTSIYAPSRKGRLSVFWGDQVFIPFASTVYGPKFHVDIMCTLGNMVGSEKEWKEKGLEKYGVIAVNKSGEAAQVEKVDHGTAVEMLKSFGDVEKVGPSLGSFSMSAAMVGALQEEFKGELRQKMGKLDTDPHFWMPMTLSKGDYTKLMVGKGVKEKTASSHYDRMGIFKLAFMDANKNAGMGLFGAIDVGGKACWWDYGQLKLYSRNNLLMLDDSEDAALLRSFMGAPPVSWTASCGSATIDNQSCIFSSKFSEGSVTRSVLSAVKSKCILADGAIVVNVSATKIHACKGSILYNVINDSNEGIVVNEGEVLVGIFQADGTYVNIKSFLTIDGGKAWTEAVMGNSQTFEEIHLANKNSNVTSIEEVRKIMHEKIARNNSRS